MFVIRLLGPPGLERDERSVPGPRGRKAWAVLAYVLLAERPPSRRHLAGLLFGDADDPMRALRWTLAELRRSLGDAATIDGDPIRLNLGPGTRVDVDAVLSPAAHVAQPPPANLDAPLLEGVELADAPSFDSWLLVERHRVAAAAEARLRYSTQQLLARGQAPEAVDHAARVVRMNPLDEGNHELLVRSLVAAGNVEAARRQVDIGDDTLFQALGVHASPALSEAAAVGSDSPTELAVNGVAAVRGQLAAGRAAIGAGTVDAGVQALRRAVHDASRVQDVAVRAEALEALGSALVHAVRGRDEEGAIVLQQAVELADATGTRDVAVAAARELGFVEVQAGRHCTADDWLARAQSVADSDDELAPIFGVRGMTSSDRADYPAAFLHLQASVAHAAAADDARQEAWSLSLLGRAHLLRREFSQARSALLRSVKLVEQQRWLAFLPWPQTLLAELALGDGDVDGASDALSRAWTLACQLGDPCWEGMAARGLGLVSARRGECEAARTWLSEAVARSSRVTDRYQWVHAHVLDTAIRLAIDAPGDAEHAAAAAALPSLHALAARGEFREIVVHAHLHQHRLGDATALTTARLLAADIDNPALGRLLDAAGAGDAADGRELTPARR